MLRAGKDYLAAIQDGRKIYLGSELVRDVTTHPAFRNTARSFADIYDRKRAAENIDSMSYEENGERYSGWYLKPLDRDGLRKRSESHRRTAAWTHGLLGRSPDHVASFVTGLAMHPELFEGNRKGFGENLTRYYDTMRREDLFAAYVVIAPQGARNPELYGRKTTIAPGLQVTAEKDDGIVLNGMKLLGTGAAFADEIWVGNLLPLPPDQKGQAVTCAVPTGTEGVTLWVRKSFEKYAVSEFDNPFSSHFDESDAVVIFDNVKVPWNRVFLLDDVVLSREMYFRTPSHIMGNHQAIVRYHEKLKLILGFAYRAAEMNSVLQIPAVRETLSKLAIAEAGLKGWIAGQIEDAENSGPYLHVNRRELYAALNWCTNNYNSLTEVVREMLGAGPFQMPADVSALTDPALRETFDRYWAAGDATAVDRMKLMKLAWDYLGSDFAGRHTQYERFYAGPQFVHALYNFNNCPWNERKQQIDDLMARMTIPAAAMRAAE
ncbi:MAG: 4-hydroxyphenylacetate 3-monooxygenase [Alphaproteobacteria bacterium]|nr:4-hydroxyphenylacetate 3-monooxygenase [Alphaproteobacteria bacterium]